MVLGVGRMSAVAMVMVETGAMVIVEAGAMVIVRGARCWQDDSSWRWWREGRDDGDYVLGVSRTMRCSDGDGGGRGDGDYAWC